MSKKQSSPPRPRDWNQMTDAERVEVLRTWEQRYVEMRPAARKAQKA